jgi:signal transduction histidine kinase/DNA-binding NarL/FixJ family response regulator
MNARDDQIIRQLFDDYLRMYASRDDRLTEYFSEDFSGITGSGDLLTKDREEWIAITRQDFAQVKDPLRIELKDLIIQSLSDTIAVVTSSFIIHLPIKDHILSRKTARLVLIFRLESAGWKISHSSISIPFAMAQEGEIYPLNDLEERNQFLEELIAERTMQLCEAKAAAEAANTAKSQFLATMSHEIRTPLNSLVGFSNLARTATDPAKQDQYLSILDQSSSSLMGLLNDILDMSKIEAGRMELEAVQFNLRQLVAGLAAQYQPLADQKALDFRVVVSDNTPAWVLGDPLRLRQILANLFSNAVKFTERGAVSCAIGPVGRSMGNGHPLIRFEVRDSGIGIPDSCRDVLFQPFRQLDPTISRKFGGTGLGLAIVHSLVGMMGGSISFDSREAVGSFFVVELPFEATEALADDLPAQQAALLSRSVLVVEDNTYNRRLLEDILTSWGQQVTLAEDGWQALRLMEQRRFDLVLLDIRMPDIDGIEVARRVRLREQERSDTSVPIIAITADADAVTRDACLKAGINAVLAKPVDPKQLLRAIAAHCGSDEAASPAQELMLNLQTCSDMGNNPERARQFRKMLLADIGDELQCLQAAFDRDDRKDVGRAAHTLKGLCGHLANWEMAELADWLQHNAPSASPEQMLQVIERLLLQVKAAGEDKS